MPTISLLTMEQNDRCTALRESKRDSQTADGWQASITAASNAAMRCALLATAFASLALSSQVQAASFDCAKAQSFSEKAVCDTPELSALDDTLAAAYARAYSASLNKPAIAATRVHEWHWRQSHCKDATCVENWYSRRIAEVDADYAQSTRRANGPASRQASAKNNPPLPPEAATSTENAANDTPANTAASTTANTAAISWALPAPSASWNYPPLPRMSSHTPSDTRKIRPLDATTSVSSRTIGIFVGF